MSCRQASIPVKDPAERYVRFLVDRRSLSFLPTLESALLRAPDAVLTGAGHDPGETIARIRTTYGNTVPIVALCNPGAEETWLSAGAVSCIRHDATSTTVLTALEAVAALAEQAVSLNPLTGLPGNRSIASRLASDVLHGTALAAYLDITGFKPFNDYYGFTRGDAVLRSLSGILSEQLQGWFLGHVGGDDFLAVGEGEDFRKAVTRAARIFKGRATGFYNQADRARGGIEALDRTGAFRSYPFMELTVTFVSGEGCGSLGRLAAMAGAEKKRVRGEEPPATVSGLFGSTGDPPGAERFLEWAGERDMDVLTLKALLESSGILGDRDMNDCLLGILRDHPDQYLRKSAVRALGGIGGEDAASAVVEALTDHSRHVRAAAVETLPTVRVHGTGELLAQAAEDGCTWVRRAALRGLGLSGWTGAMPVIEKVLSGEKLAGKSSLDHRMELEAAIEGAAFLGDRSLSGSVIAWLDGRGGVNRDLVWRSLMVLGGEDAVAAMVLRLRSPKDPGILSWLGRLPLDGVPEACLEELENALPSPDRLNGTERSILFDFLSRLPHPLPNETRVRLERMVLGDDPEVVESAISVLLARGVPPRSDEIARMVSAAGSRGGKLSRRGTVLLLQWAATGDCRISRPFLEKLLRHESREVRTAAARTVVRLAAGSENSDTHCN